MVEEEAVIDGTVWEQPILPAKTLHLLVEQPE